MEVVAHRGLRTEYPENTLEAILAALEIPGVAGCEFDVEITEDNFGMVTHQETLWNKHGRLVEATRNEASRWVNDSTRDELIKIDAGSWFDPSMNHIRIPTLESVLDLSWNNKTLLIELKDPTFWIGEDTVFEQRIIEHIAPVIANTQQERHLDIHILTFNYRFIPPLRALYPNLPVTCLFWTDRTDSPKEAISFAKKLGASGIGVADAMVELNTAWIHAAHNAGLTSLVYPVSPAKGEVRPENPLDAELRRFEWLIKEDPSWYVTDCAREVAEHSSGR